MFLGLRTVIYPAPDLSSLLAAGARPNAAVTEVGDGIRVASVLEPGGGTFLGLIENPHFQLP